MLQVEMSFQFVNTTADKRQPDEKTRRKIRSQVMKDYRRRKEEEEYSAPGSTSAPAATSLTDAQDGSKTSNAHSHSAQDPGQSSSAGLATPPGEVLGERSSKRGRPGKTQRMQAASLFVQTSHGLFANFTVDPRPTARHREANSPRRADAERKRMLEICAKYNEWLGAGGPGMAVPTEPGPVREGQEEILQLYASTMNAVGHLHAVGVFQGEDERAYYKARLLGIANQILQDPSRALDNSTLAALACLTSHEVLALCCTCHAAPNC